MASCITADQNGFIVLDGVAVFPNCSSVVLTQTEFQDLQASANNDLLQLTLADGAQIAGSILLVWAVGYSFRVLIQFLKTLDTEKEIQP